VKRPGPSAPKDDEPTEDDVFVYHTLCTTALGPSYDFYRTLCNWRQTLVGMGSSPVHMFRVEGEMMPHASCLLLPGSTTATSSASLSTPPTTETKSAPPSSSGASSGVPTAPSTGAEGAHWISYVLVPDVDVAAESAVKLGGRVVKKASDIPGTGRFAVINDPLGAVLALFNSATKDPETDD